MEPAARWPCHTVSPTLSSSRPCPLCREEDKEEEQEEEVGLKTSSPVCLGMYWRVSFKALQAATVESMAVGVGEDLGASLVMASPFPCSRRTTASSSSSSSNHIVVFPGHRTLFPGAITGRIHEEEEVRMR